MCPLCIGTATLIASGGTTASGLAAIVFRHVRRSEGTRQRKWPAWFILRRPFAGVPRGSEP